MRTTRSFKYFTDSHYLCASPNDCRLKVGVCDRVYCSDKSGEKNDYCEYAVKKLSNLVYFAWTKKFNNWKDLKIDIRKRLGASFVLPVVNIGQEYKIINPESFDECRHLVEAVIFTTDCKIKEVYGVKMEYYLSSFLSEKFNNDFERYKKNRGS